MFQLFFILLQNNIILYSDQMWTTLGRPRRTFNRWFESNFVIQQQGLHSWWHHVCPIFAKLTHLPLGNGAVIANVLFCKEFISLALCVKLLSAACHETQLKINEDWLGEGCLVTSNTWTFPKFHGTIKCQQGPKRKMDILLMITHQWFNENIYIYFTNSVISLLHLSTNFLTHTIVNFSTIFPVSNIWKTQSSWQHMDSKIVNSIHNKSFILSVTWRKQFSHEETTKCCTTRANYDDDNTHQRNKLVTG